MKVFAAIVAIKEQYVPKDGENAAIINNMTL